MNDTLDEKLSKSLSLAVTAVDVAASVAAMRRNMDRANVEEDVVVGWKAVACFSAEKATVAIMVWVKAVIVMHCLKMNYEQVGTRYPYDK
jgi:hypothetical protein